MISPLNSLPRFLHSASVLLASLPATLAAAAIYIAPTGNDANPGTANLPVATPQAAQTLVRAKIAAGLTEPVEVIFSAGTYPINAPLELRPQDSGTTAFPITWKAAGGATVLLDAGRLITSTWTNGGNGIWYTDLTGIGLGSNQWNFRQLFVSGSRATRARFPNVSLANPFLHATGGALDHAIINPALVKASWGTAADAQINMVPQSRFFNQWNTVTAVNTSTGRIDLADSERHRTINSGSWFWIEGVLAELDEPGEWFLNPTTGRLHYMPQPGVNPNTLTIIAPFLNRVVNAKGDVNADTHVEHVHFDGLQFRHTNSTIGHIEARVHTDTVIMFENTNDSSVKNCDFENIGGYALWLHLDSQRNVFDSNTVQYSGGGGVLLTGSRFAYMDDSKIYTPGEAAAKVAPILNRITRNTVEHCGKLRYYGGGVHLDSRPFSMTMSPGNYIAHNLFNDLSRNGSFAFRNQGGNVAEYNQIHNAMQTTIDGGCIRFATMNTLNAPNHVLNNWLYDIWGYEQKSTGVPTRKLANGIFLDWDSSNTTVADNWIYNSVGGAVKVIFGGNRNVVQSGNQSSDTVITPPFVAEVGPAGTATNGITIGSPVQSAPVFVGLAATFVQKLAAGTAQKIVVYGTSLTANGAWVSQLQSAVQSAYPGAATWVNSGGSGQASDWGVTNLQTKVIDQSPDTVFIEFSMNDAATVLNITREQARANLTTMVNGIRAANPQCEIILQIMNPPDRREGDPFSPRTDLPKYQQDYRDFAALNNLPCIDHMPSWQALLDKGSNAYRVHVPDGVHPSASGLTLYMTPVLLHALGVPAPPNLVPATIIDNTDSAPAMVFTGAWTNSTNIPGFIGTNYVHDGNTGKGSKSAVYTPTIPSAGTYPVFLRWISGTNRATSVPVTINHSGGSQIIQVNQRNNGGAWYKLGDFPFAAGTTGNVSVGTTGTTDGFVIVDACGFGAVTAAPREVRLRMDNARVQESAGAGGTARKSTLTVWIPEPALAPLAIQLDSSGGSATAGSDHVALPGSITIPAGKTSASVDLIPLPDALDGGDETFRVSIVPNASYTLGSPVEASIVIENKAPALIAEPFIGPATSLNGKPADVFSPAITSAGGSTAWMASSAFLQNGTVSGGNLSASLNLGNYLNNTKGTPNGKFALSMTLSEITGTWISLGFAAENTPNIQNNFTNTGVATFIYRGQNSSPAGELDMFGYLSQNAVDGPDGSTGTRTLTVTLDLTPGGGYNGSNNFGTAIWSDSVLGIIGSFTYTVNRNFGSILISGASPFAGTVSGLTLTQTLSAAPFDVWAQTNIASIQPLADATPTGDPDGDNLVNLLEFAFGMGPLSPAATSITHQNGNVSTPGLPVIIRDAGSFSAVFGRRVSYLTDGLDYEVEFSEDLAQWIPASSLIPLPSPTQVATNGVIEVIRLTFPPQIPTTNGPKPSQFFRVAVKKLL